MRKNKLILAAALIFIIALFANFALADQIQLLCLNKGETVPFSLCNPTISDRTCTSSLGCQFCVTFKTNGVYCPANINTCNSMQNLTCSPLVTSSGSGNNSTNSTNNSTNSSAGNNSTNSTNSGNQTNNIIPPIVITPTITLAEIKIAYILKDPTKPEKNVIDALNESGYKYDLIDDDNLSNVNFSKYDILLVWDERINNPSLVPVQTKKSFIANTFYLKDWKIAASAGSQVNSQYAMSKILVNDSITTGFNTPLKLYNKTSTELNYLPSFPNRAVGTQNILATNDFSTNPVIALFDKGAKLYPSTAGNSTEKTVFFGIMQDAYWTNESKEMFKRALNWLTFGEDADGDGFLSEVDCNDRNSAIHPGAAEIPYDGIDQNCDGADLLDVDVDGYCKAGAVITNKALQCPAEMANVGTDCNDDDATTNLNSSDVRKNCKNDAPVINSVSSVPSSSFQETDLVRINVDASDPENNNLSYSINDSRFNVTGNSFSWQTTYRDAGSYTFKVTASDGNLSSSQNVLFNVTRKNRAPNVTFAPNITWNEDTNASLNLSNYFFDEDGDNLTFGFAYTSNLPFIHVDLINGIFVFSVDKDWNGEDWIIFGASDGQATTNLNKITLKVNPVNDAPIFNGTIGDLTWNEDTNFSLNLSQYFNDVDSNLSYSVSGNSAININISEGIAKFSQPKDWNGNENVKFSASDGEFAVDSNNISLTVVNMPEPPVLMPLDCETSVNEDELHNCTLNATDVENDTISFSAISSSNLTCSVVGNALTYVSALNYNGLASCEVRANDRDGFDSVILNVNILAVNDAPRINSVTPAGTVKIISGGSQLFSASTSDIDSNNITTSWYLNGNLSGNGNSYLFNKTANGNYNLSVMVSDGLLNTSSSSSVVVGPISIFTCSEVLGNVCSESEVCPGSVLGVKDSNMCCSIACVPRPPTFEDADACESINSTLKVEIVSPSAGETFNLGNTVDVEARVTNNLNDDLDLTVDAHLYEKTGENSVVDISNDLQVSQGTDKNTRFNIEIPSDLELIDNKYAIFVKASNSDACNQVYKDITINRQKNQVVISQFTLDKDSVCPGDEIEAKVTAKNIGNNNQDNAYIRVDNVDLGMGEQTAPFKLEKAEQDDRKTKSIILTVPDNAKAGEYKLKATAFFDSTQASDSKTIKVGDCGQANLAVQQNVSSNADIELNSVSGQSTGTAGKTLIIAGLIFVALILVLLILYLFNYREF